MRQLGDRGIFLQRKARNAPKKFHGMSNAFHQSKPSHEIFSGRFELFVVQKNSSVTELLTQYLQYFDTTLFELLLVHIA